MGAMNWQIRLSECSLLYICAKIPRTWVFVYIFFHVDSVGVGADLSYPFPRNSTKWRCVFAPLALQFCYFIYCTPRFATSIP